MKIKRSILVLGAIIGIVSMTMAQPASTDFFRSMGKMYAVVGVVLTIFVGIIAFLIFLERKVRRLENQMDYGQKTS